jgi:hypothetical protein
MRGLLAAAAADGAKFSFPTVFRTRRMSSTSSSGVCEIRFRWLRWAYLIDCIFLLLAMLAIAFAPLLHPLEIPLLLPTTLFFGWQSCSWRYCLAPVDLDLFGR